MCNRFDGTGASPQTVGMFGSEDINLDEVKDAYDRDGYAMLRAVFPAASLAPLIDALDEGGGSPGAFSVPDANGSRQELSAWTQLGDSLMGIIPRLEPIVGLATAAVGSPVYHWHSKLSWKRPGTASEWNWHQDYGFWAEEGVTRPDMCTIAIALGPITQENGCMQLVKGSHHTGRIEIETVGPTRCSSPAIVDALIETHEVVPCTMDTGDVVVFHSNLLHSSGPNESSHQRTMLMSSYNAIDNPPVAASVPGHGVSDLQIAPVMALTDGWTSVFDHGAFIDPAASGLDYQYDIK